MAGLVPASRVFDTQYAQREDVDARAQRPGMTTVEGGAVMQGKIGLEEHFAIPGDARQFPRLLPGPHLGRAEGRGCSTCMTGGCG